nr:hypothetical protein [Bacteroidota bacterium]
MGSSLPTMVIRAAQPGYTGKVGIGTSNPQTDLDVNGTIRTAYFTLNRTTSEGYVLKSSATGSASWADPKTLGIWLLNSTNAYYTGNVGIGTSTPTSRLQVNGTIASTGFNLTDGSQNPNYVLRTDASGNASWADPQTLGIWLLNSGNTILSSGNVGIGTSAPTSKLQVNGTIASTGFNLTDGSQNTNYILKSDASGNASWTDIEDLTHWEENLQGSLVTNKITGVNVPGDSSIYGAFQIGSEFSFWGSGVSENKIISSNYTWDNGAKRIFNGRASSIVFGGNSGNITFNTAGAGTRNSQIDWEYMVFTSTGRLGIGVNTPLHTLDVQNETAVSAHFHSTTASESTIWASNTVHSYGLGVATDGTGYIYGDINQNELLTFTTDGKVLVGDECNTPGSHKLYVNGTILTTEVKIATVSEWSDYVFLPGYHLPKLSEVEEFINSNGHLPGVPSQQEVKENGINLAETDAMLLKKIEELTLYILQQDKKISQLVEKIDGMEAR